MEIKNDLYKGWDTIDEAIDYFLELILTLQNLKRAPNPPTDLFTHVTVNGEDLSDEQMDGIEISLESITP